MRKDGKGLVKRSTSTFLDDRRRRNIVEEIERDLIMQRLDELCMLGFNV